MLKLNKESNPLDQISDLIEVLDSCLGQDYLIAGGFVRDWYQDEPFNDIDIYLFGSDGYDTKTKLYSTGRFDFNKVSDSFLDTVFREKGPFLTKGHPKYNVQFISWYKNTKQVLDSFDFEHCKFFIPMDYKKAKYTTSTQFKGFVPRTPYAYNKAVETLKKKQLKLSTKSIDTLETIAIDKRDSGLAILEKYIKRTKKFKARGFLVTEELKATLLRSTELFLKASLLSNTFSSRKSVLLEDADYELGRTDKSEFSELRIARNLIKELILLHDETERAIFFVSPAPLVREVVKEMTDALEEFFGKGQLK